MDEILHEIAHALDVAEHMPKPHGHSFERALARTRGVWAAVNQGEEGEDRK